MTNMTNNDLIELLESHEEVNIKQIIYVVNKWY